MAALSDGGEGSSVARELFHANLDAHRTFLLILAKSFLRWRPLHLVEPSDAVQETLARAWKGIEGARAQNEPQLRAWLVKILRNTLITLSQHSGHENTIEIDEMAAPDVRTPSSIASDMERAMAWYDAIWGLPPAQKEAFLLYYGEKLSYAQVGERMQRTPGSVLGLLQHSRENLRRVIARE